MELELPAAAGRILAGAAALTAAAALAVCRNG